MLLANAPGILRAFPGPLPPQADLTLASAPPWSRDASNATREILGKYAAAYSKILASQPGLRHVYTDGFAGAGQHIPRATDDVVPGSPLQALRVSYSG